MEGAVRRQPDDRIIMTRVFAAAGAAIASLILGGLLLGWLLMPALGEAEIKQTVLRETGRSVTFAGRPRLSVWPELAIELRSVELSNPPDMAGGRFAAADRVRIKVSGSSLWGRRPKVTEIVVVRPRINLLVDSDGRSNFAFGRDGDGDGVDDKATAPIILVDGSVKYLNERSAATFAASDVDLTLSDAGLAGPIELDGAFNWNDQRLKLAFHAKSSARLAAGGSPADLTISGPYLNVAFSGHAAIREGLELAGTLEFQAEPLADLLSWAGHASALTGSLPALTASGKLDLSRGAIRITQADLAFGPMKATGDVALGFTGAKPRLTGDLGIDRIDLAAFAGDPGAGWSEAPLDLQFLKLMNAELVLAVSELVWGDLVAGASRLDVGLHDGVFEAALVEAKLYGGSAIGRLRLDGTGPAAALEAKLDAAGLDGGKLVAWLSGAERIRGKTDIDFDLAARGASRQELVARLRGQARMRVSDGALIKLDVPAMLDHVAAEATEGWMAGDGETPFVTLQASFAVADGIAETEDLALLGPMAEVVGTGSVDLLRGRLDLKVEPEIVASEKSDGPRALPVAVVIAGPWSAPKIYPDLAGILEDPQRAYEALRRRMAMDAAKLDLSTRDPDDEPEGATAEP
jgi:AsmA protein